MSDYNHSPERRANMKRLYRINPLKQKNASLKCNYGIDLDQFNQMIVNQKGLCLGCYKHQSEVHIRFGVDHCHKTGKVRGILCTWCNAALGNVKDSIEVLRRLADYLERNT